MSGMAELIGRHQAPLGTFDPVARWVKLTEAAETIEERETAALARAQQDRLQRVMRGYTDQELASWRSEQVAVREAEIAEHVEALTKLGWQAPPRVSRSAEASLARARAGGVDEFMRGEIKAFEERESIRRSQKSSASGPYAWR